MATVAVCPKCGKADWDPAIPGCRSCNYVLPGPRRFTKDEERILSDALWSSVEMVRDPASPPKPSKE
jgi:hypothetical protein